MNRVLSFGPKQTVLTKRLEKLYSKELYLFCVPVIIRTSYCVFQSYIQ